MRFFFNGSVKCCERRKSLLDMFKQAQETGGGGKSKVGGKQRWRRKRRMNRQEKLRAAQHPAMCHHSQCKGPQRVSPISAQIGTEGTELLLPPVPRRYSGFPGPLSPPGSTSCPSPARSFHFACRGFEKELLVIRVGKENYPVSAKGRAKGICRKREILDEDKKG